ncbi:glycosyltransferase involved in cell wall biosynthesis [Variovorax boronicumulans]|uniref:glycosyltransferase family 4 protein n=1 Tax=Variovorax boronicumulans TaxID=436515 RepID=UPI0024744EFD|nr:glycosyltransferase family 4 protein [Variovorax boronicumulans]MDH6170897.1 glycosyltransferase involved in cell wall biosynthesis [Variovorax boronicumulans]
MRILVIHQNFPGQFGHLVKAWSQRPGWDVRALGSSGAPGLPGFDKLVRYRPSRPVQARQHHYLKQMEDATLHGQASARAMLALRQGGFTPDVILAHPGWGETLYAKDVYPDARLIHLCEWYYNAEGADLGFDPEFPLSFDDRARVRTWNAQHALNLVQCDAAVSPTHWQRSRFPDILQSKIVVQHEGIDTQSLGPNPQAQVTTPSGVVLKAGDPVITYVARNLEPYRGFHIFMRALERIQKVHPQCHALIVGGDQTSYGRGPRDAANWREKMLREVTLDPFRTHFLGRLPREQYLRVLQVSAAHTYLTYPFVLSWSLLEAMACGVPIIASDTAPVREVLRDGSNGRLVEFFDSKGIGQNVLEVLDDLKSQLPLRRQACADAKEYGLQAGLRGYEQLFQVRNAEVHLNGLDHCT